MDNDYNTTSTTTLGLRSPQERKPWMIWQLVIVVSSLLTNTTILVSSIRYRALRIHRMVVIYLEQIAICDYVLSTCVVMPSVVCVVKNKWVFGRFYCLLRLDFLLFLLGEHAAGVCPDDQ